MCQIIYHSFSTFSLAKFAACFVFRGLSSFDAVDLLRRELSVPLFYAQEPSDAVVTSVWDSALSGGDHSTNTAIFIPCPRLAFVYLNYLEFARTKLNPIHPLVKPTDCTNVSACRFIKANQQLGLCNLQGVMGWTKALVNYEQIYILLAWVT